MKQLENKDTENLFHQFCSQGLLLDFKTSFPKFVYVETI